MRLLFCCENYYPSVGGVQEVMRQIAERLVRRGHDVTVATSALETRGFSELNGVKVVGFNISGNMVTGLRGDLEEYKRFVQSFKSEAILIKAAQQWTLDALIRDLACIESRVVFIPCGLSSLHEPAYESYYNMLPKALSHIDHFVFYTGEYRDIQYFRERGFNNFSIVPNGASEMEFENIDSSNLERELELSLNSFVFATVGSLTGAKGHAEVAEAFAKLKTGGREAVLVLNGASTPPGSSNSRQLTWKKSQHWLARQWRTDGPRAFASVGHQALRRLRRWTCREPLDDLNFWISKANLQASKRALLVDLPRQDVLALFKRTDLFVFASRVEYSPLVLFEAAAAGTPFLSVPVGNAKEIAQWTGAGLVCPARLDGIGQTRVDPAVLASEMSRAMKDADTLRRLGRLGRERWQRYFTWEQIVQHYEKILRGERLIFELDREVSVSAEQIVHSELEV